MGWITLNSRLHSNKYLQNEYSLELLRISNRRQRLKNEESLRMRQLENEKQDAINSNYAFMNYTQAQKALDKARAASGTSTSASQQTENAFSNIKEFTYEEASAFGLLNASQNEAYKVVKGYAGDMNKCVKTYNSDTKTLTITTEKGINYTISNDGSIHVDIPNGESFDLNSPTEAYNNGTKLKYDDVINSTEIPQAQKDAIMADPDFNDHKGRTFCYDSKTGALVVYSIYSKQNYTVYNVYNSDGSSYYSNSDGMHLNAFRYGLANICCGTQTVTGKYNETAQNIQPAVQSSAYTYDNAQKDRLITDKQKTTYERIKKSISDFDKNVITRFDKNTSKVTITTKDGTVYVIDKNGNETVTLSNGITYERTPEGKNKSGGVTFNEFADKLSASQLTKILEMAGAKDIDELKSQYKFDKSKLNGYLFFVNDDGSVTLVDSNNKATTIEQTAADKQNAKNDLVAKAEEECQCACSEWQNELLIINKVYNDFAEDIESEITEEENTLAREQADIESILQKLSLEESTLKNTIPTSIQNSTIFR